MNVAEFQSAFAKLNSTGDERNDREAGKGPSRVLEFGLGFSVEEIQTNIQPKDRGAYIKRYHWGAIYSAPRAAIISNLTFRFH